MTRVKEAAFEASKAALEEASKEGSKKGWGKNTTRNGMVARWHKLGILYSNTEDNRSYYIHISDSYIFYGTYKDITNNQIHLIRTFEELINKIMDVPEPLDHSQKTPFTRGIDYVENAFENRIKQQQAEDNQRF